MPTALAPEEADRMRALAAGDPSGAAAAANMRRLRESMQQQQQQMLEVAQRREVESEQLRHKRAAVYRLQSDVLKLRRELAAAERVEAAATCHLDRITGDEAENNPPMPIPSPRLDAERSVSREAVAQQSRQLAWRCQEIRELEEKIGGVVGANKRSREG